jgi:hypothetical protein
MQGRGTKCPWPCYGSPMRSPLFLRATLLTGSALAAMTLAAAPLSAAGAAAPTPATLYPLSVTAGKSQSSVHYNAVQSDPSTKVTISADVAKTKGKETVSFTHDKVSGKLTIYLVPTGIYINGNQSALANYMGFPAAASKKYAKRWINVPSSNSAYNQLSSGLTIKTAFSLVPVTAPYTDIPTTTVNGKKVIGVKGSTSGSSSLTDAIVKFYAQATGKLLPVNESGSASSSGQAVKVNIDYSNWNESITLPKASKVVPITKVAAPATGSGASTPTTAAG